MTPDDADLDRQLAAIERVPVSPDFTRQVLVRLDERDERNERESASNPSGTWGFAPRWSWALAILLLAVTFGGSNLWEQTQAKRELRGTLRHLEADRRALAADIERLRHLEGTEVLYLGSDDRTDYLLDLNSRHAAASNRAGSVVPASSTY